MLIYAVVTIQFEPKTTLQQAIPYTLGVSVACFFAVLQDMCDTSRAETVVSVLILTLGMMYAMVGNVFLQWPDAIVFEGFRLQQDPPLALGSLTKNEIRRSCATSGLMLLLKSLCSSFYDRRHERMLLVKRAQHKPEKIRALRRKFRSAVLAFAAVYRTQRNSRTKAIQDMLGMHGLSGDGMAHTPRVSIADF
jgi:hypothetical protein